MRGDTATETGIFPPPLQHHCVSKFAEGPPASIWLMAQTPAAPGIGRNSKSVDCPMASAAEKPKICSAPRFQLVTTPFRSSPMMASRAPSIMASLFFWAAWRSGLARGQAAGELNGSGVGMGGGGAWKHLHAAPSGLRGVPFHPASLAAQRLQVCTPSHSKTRGLRPVRPYCSWRRRCSTKAIRAVFSKPPSRARVKASAASRFLPTACKAMPTPTSQLGMAGSLRKASR